MSDLNEPLVKTETSFKDKLGLKKGGILGGILNLFSSTVGLGILGLPFALYQSGLILGSIVMILATAALTFYYVILCWASEETDVYTYVGLVKHYYGPFWRRVTEMTIAVHSFGALLGCQAVLAVMIISLLKTAGFAAADDYRVLIVTIYNAIFLILVIPEELTALRYLSSLSLLGVLYITMVVIFETPDYIANQGNTEVPMVKVSFDLVDSLSLIIFASDCSRAVSIVYSELNPRTFNRMYSVLIGTVTIVLALYLSISICGLVSQGENTAELVIDRKTATGADAENDIAMVIGRFAMSLVLLIAFPVHLAPLKLTVQQFIAGANFQPNKTRYYIVTFGSLLLTYVLALLIPDAIVVFKICGGVFIVFTSCILPNMIYYKITSPLKASALGVVTTLIAVIGISSAVKIFL